MNKNKKTHYIHGCDRGKYRSCYGTGVGPVTSDMSAVTCKTCLKIINKKKLQPKENFPEIPIFDVTAEGCWKTDDSKFGCHLVFTCPVCGTGIAHGGYYGKIGAADGHRTSHCLCWKKGYYIREVKK